MSVQQNTYVMYAVKLPGDWEGVNDDNFDEVEPYMDNAFKPVVPHNGLTLVCDGMNGEYNFIGKVIARSGDYEGLDPVQPIMSRRECNKVKALITKHFGIENPDARMWVFTHYR